jgi:hypothetical protein
MLPQRATQKSELLQHPLSIRRRTGDCLAGKIYRKKLNKLAKKLAI